MSHESIKLQATSDNIPVPSLNNTGFKAKLKFYGKCLKQDKVTFNHKTVVNIYIAHEIRLYPFKQSADFTLGNSLFGDVKLTKNADFNKYKFSRYGISFDTQGCFSLSDGSRFGKNVMYIWGWYEFIWTYWK